MQLRHPHESAIDSPASHVASEYKKYIANIRGLTVELADLNKPEVVKPLNRWCVQSGSAVEQGGAPDWEELYKILQAAPEILSLARQKCSEFNSFATKLEQGLVGERTEENEIQSPHSGRDSGQFTFRISDLMSAQVANVDPGYVTRETPPSNVPSTISNTPPPASKVRRNPLAQAVIASTRGAAVKASGGEK
jgi:hypothetical protein